MTLPKQTIQPYNTAPNMAPPAPDAHALSGPERALHNAKARMAAARNDNAGARPMVPGMVAPSPEHTQGRFKWARLLPLRQRYFLTRNGHMRLRFIVPPVLGGLLAFTFLSDLPAKMGAAGMQTIMLAASADNAGDDDLAAIRLDAMQKRLNRYAGAAGADGVGDDAHPVELAEAAPPAPAPLEPKQEEMAVRKGDTLSGVLQRAGVAAAEAFEIVKALEAHYDPRHLKAGQKLFIRFDPAEDGRRYDFAGLDMPLNAIKSVSLARDDTGSYKSALLEKQVETRLYSGRIDIENSVYGSAAKVGIPSRITAEAIRLYSYDVDFQREIRGGDSMELLYERVETEDGDFVESGNVLFARLTIGGVEKTLYRYERDGIVDYFTPEGKSVRSALMRTPIDGARMSSGYGMRRHPVLGYSRMHKGVDFAAPTGTPIYAAGDGVVEMAQRFSSYGNYVRIRHNGSLKTAYAHMNGFAKGMAPGKRVKQGEVIGYVGTTGRSTGPHLHYEVMENGVQINPNKMKMQAREPLKGKQLEAFKAHVTKMNGQYAKLSGEGPTRFAFRR